MVQPMPARPKRPKPRPAGRPDPALRSRARKILNRLAEAYPDWGPTLDFSSPLELLVATILAAQARDERINEVTRAPGRVRWRGPVRHGRAHAVARSRSQDGIDRPWSGVWGTCGGGRPPCGARRPAAPSRPCGSGHRGEPPDDLPEEGLDQGDVVLRSPRPPHLQADSALPDLSDHRPLPLPQEDEDVACGAALQPARAASTSTKASPAIMVRPSASPSPECSSGAGARPMASTST